MSDAIVVGVDGSEQAMRAVRWAAAEAASRNLPLRLVNGIEPIGYYGGGMPISQQTVDQLEEYAQSWLAEAAGAVGPDVVTTTKRVQAPPIPALLEEASSADMIVLGASGRGGFTGMLAGATAVAVSSHAPCPVVVVRGRGDGGGPVVVGVDGSPTSERALAAAFDEAAWRNVPLVAVHAWSDADYVTALPLEYALTEQEPPEDEQGRVLAESLAGWGERYPDVRVERVVVRDRPRHQLLDRAAKAQLVVVGSRGRGGFRGMLLGSTSQALIHHADCPVMVVRPE